MIKPLHTNVVRRSASSACHVMVATIDSVMVGSSGWSRDSRLQRSLRHHVVTGLWDLCLLYACRIRHAGSRHWTCEEYAGHLDQEPAHSVHGNFRMVFLGMVTGLWR